MNESITEMTKRMLGAEDSDVFKSFQQQLIQLEGSLRNHYGEYSQYKADLEGRLGNSSVGGVSKRVDELHKKMTDLHNGLAELKNRKAKKIKFTPMTDEKGRITGGDFTEE